MPSFDVVSEVDQHEFANALDQAERELTQRFDFKGTRARFERTDNVVSIIAESEFQISQMLDILQTRCGKRGIDVQCLELGAITANVAETRQAVTVREGIDTDLARKLVRLIKDSKLKVQAQVQQQQLRVTGKNRDDLQRAIALLKDAPLDYPLQFKNFRD